MSETAKRRPGAAEAALGHRFATALAARDRAALVEFLAPDVDFAGLTPGRSWQAGSAVDLVDDVLLACWFEDTDRVEEVVGVSSDQVGGRSHLAYRFRVRNAGGLFLVEQQAYYEVDAGRISWLRVLCSGFQPIDAG